MNGAYDMKSRYGKTLICRIVKNFWFMTLLGCFLTSHAYGFFCRCVPSGYTDFRIFVAPQVARLKFNVNDLAVYRGVFTGGSAGFEYRPFCDFYFGAFAEWMMGDCDSEMQMSRYIHDLDGQCRLGYSFPMWNFYKLTFTPFLGLGYIQVTQHIRPDLVLPSEKFRYVNYYFPYGILIDFKITHHFGFGFVLESKLSVNQRLKTPYIQGAKFKLDRESGYLLEAPFNLYLGGSKAKAEVSIIPYIKREVDGRLNASLPDGAVLTLPKQSYKYWGLRLAIGATF